MMLPVIILFFILNSFKYIYKFNSCSKGLEIVFKVHIDNDYIKASPIDQLRANNIVNIDSIIVGANKHEAVFYATILPVCKHIFNKKIYN